MLTINVSLRMIFSCKPPTSACDIPIAAYNRAEVGIVRPIALNDAMYSAFVTIQISLCGTSVVAIGRPACEGSLMPVDVLAIIVHKHLRCENM